MSYNLSLSNQDKGTINILLPEFNHNLATNDSYTNFTRF